MGRNGHRNQRDGARVGAGKEREGKVASRRNTGLRLFLGLDWDGFLDLGWAGLHWEIGVMGGVAALMRTMILYRRHEVKAKKGVSRKRCLYKFSTHLHRLI